jgi:type IV secretion system protein TrbL
MTVLADVGVGPISIPTPGDVVGALKNAVVDVADAVFDKIIEWIAGLLADAVAKVTEALVTLLAAVKPSITPGGQIENAVPIQQSVLGLAASLVTLFFVFRIIHGLITGQAGQNLRATLVDLPMVIVGTLFFGFLCYLLLTIVDQFSDPLITDYATTLNTTVSELYSKDGIVQGGVFVIIFALLYIVGAVFLCFELFVRSSLIYLVVMFAPLAIATRIWGPTRSYARRATETAVALIFSKLAIAVTLATGASLMSGAADSGGNVAMIQGSAILLLAAFMPFALMRVIPMMEGAIAGEGVARTMGIKAAGGGVVAAGVGQAAMKPISSMTNRVSGARNASGSGGGSSDGGAAGDAGVPPADGPSGGGPSTSAVSSSKPAGSSGGGTPTPRGSSGPSESSAAGTSKASRSDSSSTATSSQPATSPTAERSDTANPTTSGPSKPVAASSTPVPDRQPSHRNSQRASPPAATPTSSPGNADSDPGPTSARTAKPPKQNTTQEPSTQTSLAVKPPTVKRPTLNRRPEGDR